jgi:cytochrome b561
MTNQTQPAGSLRLRNSANEWGLVALAFHWFGAAVIFFLLAHGWWMAEFAPRASRLEHYALHASAGYGLLALVLLRLLWRWMNEVPALPAATPRWERVAAHAGHWGLYLLMLAAAVSGWALSGTMRRPLDSFFGLFQVPSLVAGADRALHQALEEFHERLAWGLTALVAIHIAASIYHYVVRKDGVLERMASPWSRK